MILVRRGLGAMTTPSGSIATALQNASNQYGVPLPLLTAVAYAESRYNPSVTSSAGAQGLLQIMPANDATLGITNPFDPQQSANAGAQYLSQLYAQYGDWTTALIAYNEGPGNLASKGPFSSSQSYAAGILANANLPSDSSPAQTPSDSSTVLQTPNPGDSSIFDLLNAPTDNSTVQFVDDSGNLTGWGWAGIAAVVGLGVVLVVSG